MGSPHIQHPAPVRRRAARMRSRVVVLRPIPHTPCEAVGPRATRPGRWGRRVRGAARWVCWPSVCSSACLWQPVSYPALAGEPGLVRPGVVAAHGQGVQSFGADPCVAGACTAGVAHGASVLPPARPGRLLSVGAGGAGPGASVWPGDVGGMKKASASRWGCCSPAAILAHTLSTPVNRWCTRRVG